MARALQPCGTEAAYYRHRYHREVPCDPCHAARRDAERRRTGAQPRVLATCGTPAARQRHARLAETCTACNSWPGKPSGQLPTEPCGTEAAYQRHRRHREQACEPCKTAHAAYVREQRAAA